MGSFSRMEFDPPTGLKDKETYITTPATEDAAREQIQRISDQLKDHINNFILEELENAETGTSGAERIGSAELFGVTGLTVRDQIADLANTVSGVDGISEPGNETVSTQKIQDRAVTGIKIGLKAVKADNIDDGIIGTTQIANGAITAAKFAGNEIDGSVITNGTVSDTKLDTDAVTETKIKSGAVTIAKINTASKTDNINENTSSKLATAKAVKIAYDKGAVAYTKGVDAYNKGVAAYNKAEDALYTANQKEPELDNDQKRKITIQTREPLATEGSNGDIWLEII